jgi:general secretion pathway protein D
VDSGEGGLSQSLVKFQAIARANSILVVSRRPGLLKTNATWIERLDSSDSASPSVHVYRVQYGNARQMAKVLNNTFAGGAAAVRRGGRGRDSSAPKCPIA